MTFFRHFVDKLFLNKGGGSLGLLNFQKWVFLALKYNLVGEKRQKITIFQYQWNSILEVQYSILFDNVKSFEISGIKRDS